MNARIVVGSVAVSLGLAATAAADETRENRELPDGRWMVGTTTGFIHTPFVDPSNVIAHHHFSNILFVNRCATSGSCSVSCGQDDSSSNRSSVACSGSGGSLQPFEYGDAKWAELMGCVRQIFAPFNIVITDIDPGSTEHMEVMVAGSPGQIGLQIPGVLGVAPATCGYVDRAVAYVFANESYFGGGGGNIDELCSTVGQEIAHTWALDHERLAADPMTYIPYSGRRTFQDVDAPCGELSGNRTCKRYDFNGDGTVDLNCPQSGPTQNSVQEILARFGAGVPMNTSCNTVAECNELGTGYICHNGSCVLGPGQPGGLGATCAGPADCYSMACLSDGDENRCTEPCGGSVGCPDNFECKAYGEGGVCWPEGGGICAAGGKPTDALPIAVGIGFALFVSGRRRRPRRPRA
jgi:hypothetical protein